MSRICIACPMRKEAEALSECLGPRQEVVASGLGIKRTLPFLLKRFRSEPPALLIFTGSASQLDLSLEMGDVVLPERWQIENGPSFSCHGPTIEILRAAGFATCELGISLSQPVMKAGQRQQLLEETRASIYDSVTAAVLRVAETSEVPCIAPKIVAGTVKSGLMTFWSDLDHHIDPLASYLHKTIEVLVRL